MTSLAGSARDEPRLWRADHAGAAYNRDIEDCRAAIVEGSGLHYVAHVTYGILDFALGTPARWPGGESMATTAESAVRQLSLATAQLERWCEPLDSGALIRVVLQGENGALFQVLKVAGQSFFGLTFEGDQEAVTRADARLAALAETSSGRIGGSSLDWGGFRDRDRSGELLLSQRGSKAADAAPAAVDAGPRGVIPEPVLDACRQALHPDNLHYVSIYRGDELLWCADIFDTPELEPFFQVVSPDTRRRGYLHLLKQVGLQYRRFGQLLALVRSERLVRLVLDVARGAVYVFPLAGDDCLVAVTLIQSRVDEADQRARSLHGAISPSWPVPAPSPVARP